ncbi:MAG TPA: DHA2 family efflux MFS transporter permease subunit [Amnibacterium sp.]|jgi:DHA2 family lincomycin resistance protein-like MFS transporter|uniref:DHA2 family efflux MFS transporter permease subunit n=1 Tax=Amnibacterium sp. TaxID=1872496 RepID=UPI002F91EE78
MTRTAPPPSVAPPVAGKLSARDRTVITVLLVAAFVVILNETIMTVAIPVLMKDLSIDASTGQWLSTAFALTLAVVIPVTGFLIQRMTTRQLFLLSMGLFSAGTLTAGLSVGYPMLLLARIIQGCGTAVMIPLLMTTVITLVPESSRGRMMGNISVVISVAPALGPTISGLILSVLDWRWIFWLVLPIALAAMALGGWLMTNVGETRKVRIDLISIPLAALGFGGLVYGLNAVGEVASGAASPAMIWVPVGVGAVTLTLFLLRQLVLQRTDRALLDLRPFKSRVFTFSVIAGAFAFLALLGSAILLPIYLQNVLGVTPLVTGLLVLPGGVLMGVLGPVVGRLYDLHGPRALLIPSSLIGTLALVLLGTVTEATPLWFVLGAHMLLSVGLAGVLTPLFTAGLSAVPERYTSYGSAIFATVQQVGGAAGTALVVTLLAVQTAAGQAAGASTAVAAAGGVRVAFLVAAGVFLALIVLSVFITRDEAAEPRAIPAHA